MIKRSIIAFTVVHYIDSNNEPRHEKTCVGVSD